MSGVFDALAAGVARMKEIARLTQAVNQARRKLDDALAQAGRRGYELFRRGQLEDKELAGAYEQIVPLDQELNRLRTELERVKAAAPQGAVALPCPRCQATVNPGQLFCPSCGTRIPVCPNCGGMIIPAAKFCSACGAKTGSNATPGANEPD